MKRPDKDSSTPWVVAALLIQASVVEAIYMAKAKTDQTYRQELRPSGD
jgi:hypothetical protein